MREEQQGRAGSMTASSAHGDVNTRMASDCLRPIGIKRITDVNYVKSYKHKHDTGVVATGEGCVGKEQQGRMGRHIAASSAHGNHQRSQTRGWSAIVCILYV